MESPEEIFDPERYFKGFSKRYDQEIKEYVGGKSKEEIIEELTQEGWQFIDQYDFPLKKDVGNKSKKIKIVGLGKTYLLFEKNN